MVGQTISHYRVLEKLGEGGMGVVYKAEDTKLDRPVALKFLPAHLLGNEDIRKRFQREAKAAAALDHPNICTVHEIDEAEGKTFISMALIEGESLDQKIARGPLKLDEALSIAQQVAKGLEAAHKRGIVHRDIKPENIMVGDDGHVTIMDFGLAQLTEASRLTRTDETVGTVGYMSPEQTEGSGTDHRTDIWSLGVVLYEMVTGQQPFKGDYDKAVMYSILNEAPEPITALRTGVPIELEVAVAKCLSKKSSERYQSVSDLAIDLHRVSDDTAANAAPRTIRAQPLAPAGGPRMRTLSIYAAAATVVAALVWNAPSLLQTQPSWNSLPLRKVTLPLPPNRYSVVISPDGTKVVYSHGPVDTDQVSVWLQDLAETEPRRLHGPSRVAQRLPFWSPDSRSVGFLDDGSLMIASLDGGARRLTDFDRGGHGDWSFDGRRIVFSQGRSLYFIDVSTGEKQLVYSAPDGVSGLAVPKFLPAPASPDVVLTRESRGEPGLADDQIVVVDTETGTSRAIMDGYIADYSPSGHIVIGRGAPMDQSKPGSVWAVRFELDSLSSTGEPFQIAEDTSVWPVVSEEGTLLYMEVVGDSTQGRTLVIRGESGDHIDEIGQVLPSGSNPTLSPDGSQVAMVSNGDVWIQDSERRVATRLTFDQRGVRNPVWIGSRNALAFAARADNGYLLYWKEADSDVPPSPISSSSESDQYISDWSPDGSAALVCRKNEPNDNWDMFLLTGAADGVKGEEQPFLNSSANEETAQFHPSGRFVTYVSDLTGRNEVYVRRFPSGAGETRISLDGGEEPRWNGDGSKLFYIEGDTLLSVDVSVGESVVTGQIQRLFSHVEFSFGYNQFRYDVFPTRNLFVLAEWRGGLQIRMVQNWYEEFRDRE